MYGVTNDSIIKGAFLIRGQEALPAFDVAPDYESYEFTKLDPRSEKDRKFFDSMMAWDEPIEVKGKKVGPAQSQPSHAWVKTSANQAQYEWADGKIFV